MRIVFDNIIFSLQQYGGISVVWSKLISKVCRQECDVTFIEYDGAEQNVSRKEMALPQDKIEKRKTRFMQIARYLNPRVDAAKGQTFIFHSSYYRTSSHPDAVNVTTVHDFAYEYYVKNPIIRMFHSFQKFRAIRRSERVVCISENTRRDLLNLIPDVDPQRVSVIYNGVDNKYFREPGAAVEDYVLYVGNRDRYKNFTAIIQPLAQCGRKLKIAGKALTAEEIRMMNEAGLKYEYCGVVTDTELNHLYNHAFCLIYSSLYEGFGLPVVEAQMAGCPVIAVNVSSIPEVIGDKRMLVDEVSKASLIEKLQQLEQPDFRQEVIAAGLKKSATFSWDRMAQQYMALYDELLSTRP